MRGSDVFAEEKTHAWELGVSMKCCFVFIVFIFVHTIVHLVALVPVVSMIGLDTFMPIWSSVRCVPDLVSGSCSFPYSSLDWQQVYHVARKARPNLVEPGDEFVLQDQQCYSKPGVTSSQFSERTKTAFVV